MLAFVFLMTLLPPVPGPVVRPFVGGEDPFARGLRRAVVLSAAAGSPVRAPCTGAARFAGWTPRGPAVTLRCGRRRVTVMPVRSGVVPGARVRRGARLGAATGDVGVSVRTPDGAYVAPRFAQPLGAPPPVASRPRPREPRAPAVPRGVPDRAPAPVAPPALPWPAWAGAGLLLASAAAGIRVRRRQSRGARRRSLSAQPWTPP